MCTVVEGVCKLKSKKKKGRMDFTIEEITRIGEDNHSVYYRFRMVPDKRSWKRAEIGGKSGYLNKFDNAFIPDEEMAKAVKTLKDVPIAVSTVDIGTEQEYLEKSKKRVRAGNE